MYAKNNKNFHAHTIYAFLPHVQGVLKMPPRRVLRRLILTLNQVRALNAISRAKNKPPRFQEIGTAIFVVSTNGLRHELSNTNVVD